jgi:hypothetical protein
MKKTLMYFYPTGLVRPEPCTAILKNIKRKGEKEKLGTVKRKTYHVIPKRHLQSMNRSQDHPCCFRYLFSAKTSVLEKHCKEALS